MMMKNKSLILLLFLFFLNSCFKVPNKIEPKISVPVSESFIKSLKSPFSPLSLEEKSQDWGKEYTIAIAFAKKGDLYQAISNFKRAEILILPEDPRKQEIEYFIVLCYYFGMRYASVIDAFENSSLPSVDSNFVAFQDLLIILYHSYKETNDKEKVERIKKVIDTSFPGSGEEINLAQALLDGNVKKIKELAKDGSYPYLSSFLSTYESKKKSIPGAQILNAIVPGLGYFYLGQKKSAVTSFLLNGAFIYASYEFFKKGYIGAGVITSSFEAGWYFGGIYGAGEAAKFYNERLYDEEAKKLMGAKKIYPIFMLRYAF